MSDSKNVADCCSHHLDFRSARNRKKESEEGIGISIATLSVVSDWFSQPFPGPVLRSAQRRDVRQRFIAVEDAAVENGLVIFSPSSVIAEKARSKIAQRAQTDRIEQDSPEFV